MNSLMISPSGVRGIVGKGLTPEVISELASAFGSLRPGKILVGYDTRTSNQMFKYAVFSGLLSVGCHAIDVGICPTPSLQLMVKDTDAKGGIVITGSHNPVEWNALKFIRDDGLFLYPEEGEELIRLYKRGNIPRAGWNKIGKVSFDDQAVAHHLQSILRVVNVNEIRNKKFKVVIDACNGAASVISPVLLEKLGCQVIRLNCKPDGIFPRPPEPVPENLEELSKVVKEHQADIGFAHDADADRLVLVSEQGEPLSEEYTLAIVTRFVLKEKTKGPVVTNICTSQTVEDVVKEFGCQIVRTKVGDIHVSRKMKDCGAVIGGEGNGGVIFPSLNYARDGIVSIALILNYLAAENRTISSICEELPRYYMIKKKIESQGFNFELLKEEVIKRFESEDLDFLDGMKIKLPKGWVHIRPSGTEPVLRLISEAENSEIAGKNLKWALELIERFKGEGK